MTGRRLAALLLFAVGAAGFLFAQVPSPAIHLYYSGKFQQSAEILAKIASNSTDADIHLWLGKCWLKLKKLDAAIRELETAYHLSPADSTIRLWLGRAYGGKASSVSFFSAPGWARKVVEQFEAAVRLNPRNMDARFDLLEYYLEAPGFLGGGKEKAEAQTKEIASLDARLGFRARARALENEKKYDLAAQQLALAVQEFPRDASAFVALASFQLDRKNYAEAGANARRALGIDPGNVKSKLLACGASVSMGEGIQECTRILQKIASGPLGDDSDPGFEDVYYWLGRAFEAERKTAEARQAYRTALSYDPDHEAAKSALAQLR
jgi:tetratricopeptide (TPR) repeat protein